MSETFDQAEVITRAARLRDVRDNRIVDETADTCCVWLTLADVNALTDAVDSNDAVRARWSAETVAALAHAEDVLLACVAAMLDARGRPRTLDEEGERLSRAHSNRFRKVANGYARRVSEAYGRDLARAAADSDAQVAAAVAAWERAQGIEPIDWVAQGQREGKADPDRDGRSDPRRRTH